MPLSPQLLDVLVCPQCRGDLEYLQEGLTEALVCHACRLRYAVEDDIPILLIDEATPLD